MTTVDQSSELLRSCWNWNWKQGDEDGDVRRGKKFEEEFVSLMMNLEKERRSLLAEKRGKKVQS
ncbi:unnamed protein product [Lathyrus oleraceus]